MHDLKEERFTVASLFSSQLADSKATRMAWLKGLGKGERLGARWPGSREQSKELGVEAPRQGPSFPKDPHP